MRTKPETAIFVAESGVVRADVGGPVRWRMTADEAEELADFLDRMLPEDDAVRASVGALRHGVSYARGEVCIACGAVLEDGDEPHRFTAPDLRDVYTCEIRS